MAARSSRQIAVGPPGTPEPSPPLAQFNREVLQVSLAGRGLGPAALRAGGGTGRAAQRPRAEPLLRREIMLGRLRLAVSPGRGGQPAAGPASSPRVRAPSRLPPHLFPPQQHGNGERGGSGGEELLPLGRSRRGRRLLAIPPRRARVS